MSIRRVFVYKTKDKQFPTMTAAVDYREGLVEEFLRKSPGFNELPVKQRVAFVRHILDNRKFLTDLLDYQNADDDPAE